MERASAVEWAKRVERWKDSGLTAKEFAAESGLKASMLSYWQWKLRASGVSARDAGTGEQTRKRTLAKSGATGRSRELAGPGPMQFVELPATVVTSPEPALEVVLDGGQRVRVSVGFDEATLTRVLRALEASR